MVSADENMELTIPFSPEEIRRAIMEMKPTLPQGQTGYRLSSSRNFGRGFRL
jgi:hypothetical protein